MNNSYERLLQNLNIVKWDLRERNDSSLNLCIKYIKDAIIEAGRLNTRLMHLESAYAGQDDADDWSED